VDTQQLFEQLAGTQMKLVIMTGAKNFMLNGNTLTFQIMKNKTKGNRVSITLNVMDTYDIEFFSFRNFEKQTKVELNNIYGDQLREVFEETTGLYLSL